MSNTAEDIKANEIEKVENKVLLPVKLSPLLAKELHSHCQMLGLKEEELMASLISKYLTGA